MKGLVYRELLLARKNVIAIFIAGLLLSILHILFLLSLRYGNLAKDTSGRFSDIRGALTFLLYAAGLIFCVAASSIAGNIYKDYRSKWMTYAYTLPGGQRRGIRARYLAFLILFFGGVLAGFTNIFLISLLDGKLALRDTCINFTFCLCIFMIGVSFVIPAAYWCKSEEKTIALLTVFLAAAIVGVYLFGKLSDTGRLLFDTLGKYAAGEPVNPKKVESLKAELIVMRNEGLPFLLLAAVTGTAVGYLVSVWNMARKEK